MTLTETIAGASARGTLELAAANNAMRDAVRRRLEPNESSCCEGQRTRVINSDGQDCKRIPTAAEVVERFNQTHPTSKAFYDLCDEMKATHKSKSHDYGSPDDPLANIRNGAKFVGIEPWRAAAVRLSDKVTRLETYCRTGSLTYESFEDTLIDLASYALLTLLTHREARDGCSK